MKKTTLFIALIATACLTGSFTNHHVTSTALKQAMVQPFCKFTFVDHRGHSVKLSTGVMHASYKSLTFIFDGGEKLIISFTTLRAGHFVAESARSKDPQIVFYPNHASSPMPMVGAVIISSTKPVSGNFSHLVSDDDEVHLTLVSGSFSF